MRALFHRSLIIITIVNLDLPIINLSMKHQRLVILGDILNFYIFTKIMQSNTFLFLIHNNAFLLLFLDLNGPRSRHYHIERGEFGGLIRVLVTRANLGDLTVTWKPRRVSFIYLRSVFYN